MLDPDAVAARTFGSSFRGYDHDEVRQFLVEVAAELRAVAAGAFVDIDEDKATRLAGEEAGRLISSARGQAADIVARAEAKAAELLQEAEAERHRLLAEVDAERERAAVEAEEARGRKEAEGRAEADRLVAEATAAREHVLRDLARRRTAMRTQVEQLHAARDKLLESLADVARAVDEARGRLVVSLPEAKVAADAAARRVQDEPELTTEHLEAELGAFRLAGIPLGPVEEADGPGDDGDAVEAAPELEVAPEPEPEPERAAEALTVEAVEVPPEEAEQPTFEVGRHSPSVRVFRGEPDGAVEEAEQELDVVVEHLEPEREPDAEADEPVDGEGPVPEDEPVGEAEPIVDEPAADDEPALSSDTVDELFAKLRAGRESRTAAAEVLLAEPEVATELADEPVIEEVTVAPAGGTDRTALLARRDELLGPPMQSLTRRMKRLLADEQNAVLDALRRAVPGAAAPAADDLAARWSKAAADDLAAAAAAGATFIGIDAAPDVVGLGDELVSGVTQPLAERLADAIARAEGDADAAAESVRSTCREWRGRRLTDGVEHAVRAAFGKGALAATPAGTGLCWVVDDGGTPCPDAEDNALAGVVAAGEPFPTGHRHPPAHPGCRCVLAPPC